MFMTTTSYAITLHISQKIQNNYEDIKTKHKKERGKPFSMIE